MSGEPTTAAEMAALKDEFDSLRSRVNALEAHRQGVLGGLSEATGLSRRQLLAIAGTGAGVGALGTFGAQPASGAAQPSGGEGDVGTTSTPFEGFADGMALVTTDISSATTVTKPVVRYDCSVSGFTITLGTELEGPSGFAQRVVLIDETGNAGSNAVTVDTESGNNIDGGGSITISHDHAVTVLWWDGSEWRSTRFIDTVDAGSVTSDSKALNTDITFLDIGFNQADTSSRLITRHTEDVSTSAKTILGDPGNKSGCMISVLGKDNGNNEEFHDIVNFLRGSGSVDAVSSVDSSGAAGRTYSRPGGLDLAMASDTYQVTVSAVVSRSQD